MNATSCPSRDELADYLLGKLSDATIQAVEDHLANCPDCEETVASLDTATDSVVAALQQSIEENAYVREPEYCAALVQIRGLRTSAGSGDPRTADQEMGYPAAMEQLGPYKLLATLGAGAMGTVYKAVHTKLDKVVALKVLPADRMKHKTPVGRFEREMKAVGKLQHPNIVQAYDAGDVDSTHFLSMEHVDGIDLSKLVECVGPLGIPDACELARQAALGLAYAHEHGLVHRDIKPSNLMLMVEGRGPSVEGESQSAIDNRQSAMVKILDFGLALLHSRYADEATELTSDGQIMGTLDYMAPEQGMDSHDVDIRADIYSLAPRCTSCCVVRRRLRASSMTRR